LVDLIRNMDRRRYDISVCGIRGGPLKREIENLGISVHVVGKRAWWELPWIALQLYKHVKDKKPLVLQSSLFYTNLLTGFIGRLLKVPILVAVEHSVYSMHLSRWMGGLAALTRRLVDATVTVFEEQKIRGQGGSQTVYIPNGVDLGRFDVQVDRDLLFGRYGTTRDSIIMLTAGRLSSVKGQAYLIEATALLMKKFSSLKLFIAGEGELRGQLEQLVRDRGLNTKVIFLGRRDDMPFLYHLCDVFVMPSLHEGFGLAAAEAMASRRPVVATQALGMTGLVVDGETGFLVPAKDPLAIAKKVEQVLTSPELAKDVADAGFRRVKSFFSSERMTKRYMDLYEKLMTERNLSVFT
jgi:glycosyltransferase involved in cell wall biosynthesis